MTNSIAGAPAHNALPDADVSAEDRLCAVETALVHVSVKLDALTTVFQERLEAMSDLNAQMARDLARQAEALEAVAGKAASGAKDDSEAA